MSLDSDKLLIEAFNANKELGLRRIMEKFQERVYWQIRRMTMNHQDTEDIMQNVFIKVWHNLPKFQGKSALYSWIYRIAYNETVTFLRKENKMKKQDIDQPLIQNSVIIEGKEWSGNEISALLKNAIATLPEKQAQVFELKYFDDLKYSEISEMLGTTVGGLKASYHLAVKKIEEILKAI